jgi:hypothetical protein
MVLILSIAAEQPRVAARTASKDAQHVMTDHPTEPPMPRQSNSTTGRSSSMNIDRLLAAALLAVAIGAPIAGFGSDVKGQPMTSSEVRVPFLHSFPIGPLTAKTSWLRSSAPMNG